MAPNAIGSLKPMRAVGGRFERMTRTAAAKPVSRVAGTSTTSSAAMRGVVPTLILFQQPFGINALVGLIALSGILMRNTLILIGQIHHNDRAGLSPFDAVVEATVQRARPVILTALAAVLAFIPLTHSVFWGTLAYTLIGGTLAGTVLTLVFLPAMYAIWFRIAPGADRTVRPRPPA